MTLPTEKNTPGVNPLNKKTVIYGPQKVGKSTLVSQLYPNAAFIVTDPSGFEELEVYDVRCPSWQGFREIGKELVTYLRANPPGSESCLYDAFCVDTVDELVRQCRVDVLSKLTGGPANKNDFVHESDWEYGKAWNAVAEEFRLRVAKLCNLGLPVVFVSHSKVKTKKNRTGQEITVHSPDIGGGSVGEWLLKFVDYIFFAEMLNTPDGERRILHTQPAESYLAGYRWPQDRAPLPDPLPLDGRRLRAALKGNTTAQLERDVATMADGDSSRTSQEPERSSGVDIGHEPPVRQNGKREPKKIKDARKIVEAIPAARVAKGEYTDNEAAAMNTISQYQAEQREKEAAS